MNAIEQAYRVELSSEGKFAIYVYKIDYTTYYDTEEARWYQVYGYDPTFNEEDAFFARLDSFAETPQGAITMALRAKQSEMYEIFELFLDLKEEIA